LNLLGKHIKDTATIGKSKWNAELSAKIHDMSMSPNLAWDCIQKLNGEELSHHKKSKSIKIMYPQFQKVFNNQRQVDYSVLDLI